MAFPLRGSPFTLPTRSRPTRSSPLLPFLTCAIAVSPGFPRISPKPCKKVSTLTSSEARTSILRRSRLATTSAADDDSGFASDEEFAEEDKLEALHGAEAEELAAGTPRSPGPGVMTFSSQTSQAFLSEGEDSGFVDYADVDTEGAQQQVKLPKLALPWFLAPLLLVLSVVLPPRYLRPLLLSTIGDCTLSDFLALFIADAVFMVASFGFLRLVSLQFVPKHKNDPAGSEAVSSRPHSELEPGKKAKKKKTKLPVGLESWNFATVAFGCVLPLSVFVLIFPTAAGQVAAAVFVPYFVLLAGQWVAQSQLFPPERSLVAPLLPLLFQVYRLHQLNRGAMLLSGLITSLASPEPTPQILQVDASLRALLATVQALGLTWVADLCVRLALLPREYFALKLRTNTPAAAFA